MTRSPEPPGWARLARIVLGARSLPLIFLVLVVGGLAALPRLQFDFSPQTLFDSTSERAAVYRAYREQYGADDHTLLVLVEADLRRLATWELIRDVEQAVAAVPGIERHASVVTAPVPQRIDDALEAAPLPFPDSEAEAAERAERATRHPLLRHALVAPSGGVHTVLLKVADDVQRISDVRPLVTAVRDVLTEQEARSDGARLHLLGPHAYRSTVVSVMVREELRFAPLTACILALVLGLLFRSAQGVLIPLLSVGLGALWTLALMALTGEPVNIINTITATLILVIGVADAIHMMERYGHERDAGRSRREAARTALLWVGGACLLTSLTTAVGFATLSTAHLEILRRFGLYSAAGVMITFVTTIVFVPWALDRAGLRRGEEARPAPRWEAKLDDALMRLSEGVIRRPRTVVLLSLLVTAAFALGITRTTVDNFIMEYVPRDDPILEAHGLLEEQLAGVVFVDVLLDVEGEAGAEPWLEPELLDRVASVEAAVLEHPEVHAADSILGFLREMRWVQRGQEGARDALPESRAEVASLVLLYDMGDPELLAAQQYLSTDRRRLRLTFRAGDLGARGYLALEKDLGERIERTFADAGVQVAATITGTSQVGYAGIDSLIRDLLGSLGWAFLLIFVTLALLFRSVPLAALAMGPNLVPIVWVLGAMGWAGQHLETLSAMVFSIGLGIAVDDTIHFLARYRQEVRAGHSPEDAVRRTTKSTGRAIVTTSLVLLFGFGVLYTSAFPPNQSFAVLAGAVIASALVADLWMLPALLLWWRPKVG